MAELDPAAHRQAAANAAWDAYLLTRQAERHLTQADMPQAAARAEDLASQLRRLWGQLTPPGQLIPQRGGDDHGDQG